MAMLSPATTRRSTIAGAAWALAGIISLGAAPGVAADPIEGIWRLEFSCKGATGMYADRCASGMRDDFSLSLVRYRNGFCGGYELTYQLGNHVDDGDVSDWKFEPTGPGKYDVLFHFSGSTGHAKVRVIGSKLHWRTVDVRQDPEGWINFTPPKNAVLTKKPGRLKSSDCDG